MVKKIALVLLILNVLSCEQIIEVQDISNEVVIILAPSNNAILEGASISFTWEPVEFAETYQLQISKPNFQESQEFLADTIITSTNFIKSLPNDSYQWRIKALNYSYETSYTTQNLTIEN